MNIVVKVADGLRTDYIGSFASRIDIPTTDSLGSQGVQLNQTYAEILSILPTRLLKEVEDIFPQDLTSKDSRQKPGEQSLIPLLNGQVNNVRDFAVGDYYCNREWYLRPERWSHFYPLDEHKEQLFDRQNDPMEQINQTEKEEKR